ncbi:hypothetical protein [Halopseudomonas yangmingensis]|uniref:Uncharacterized protein n=1 Tax=Halopseudomonas yangmingensis TaxID=1720063 RepID=A0A1I4N9V1_9GAMM|nr:hypothetical protein [Halopseudomonas yangmingensis]SFM12291.1 hypothetical protein SAMN05216217_101162 [Halopseudomonas yangmingensis]
MNALRYIGAAFNARPLGMPIPPNWLGLAAFGLLGALLNPGFWALGAGLELAYLYLLANNQRFQRSVLAAGQPVAAPEDHYQQLLEALDPASRADQQALEVRAREVMQLLTRSALLASHVDSLEQLVWLNLRLLAARQAIARVVETAQGEREALLTQEQQIAERLQDPQLGEELRRSLQQQQGVIDARQAGHQQAERRLEHVEAELQRIGQQVALIREQALLASDQQHIGASLDALTASFTEASSWLDSQRELLGVLDQHDSQRLPAHVLQTPAAVRQSTTPLDQ